MKVEEFTIEVPDGNIYLKKWTPNTSASKAPVILLHDSLGSVDLWKDFPAVLSENLTRPIIAYDRLGFGKSDSRNDLPSKTFIEEEASKYFPAIKKHLGIQNYVLCGHSVGGGIAIHIASQDADCDAVITVSSQAFIEERTLQGIADAKKMFEQAGQIERLEKWHGNKASWVLRAWTEVWLSSDFANWSVTPAIHNVRCPLLAIHGENDEFGSAAFPEFLSQNTNGPANTLLLKDCGHVPHKEKPQEVISAVKDLLGNAVS